MAIISSQAPSFKDDSAMSDVKPTEVDANVSGQWPLLAGLRFIFASIVMFTHIFNIVGVDGPFEKVAMKLGGLGAVFCFFLISGYSIAASVGRDQSHFYKRRVWRIAPVFYAALALSIAPYLYFKLHHFVFPSGIPAPCPSLGLIIETGLFLTGLIVPTFVLFGAVWSLVCEVVYYAFAPWFNKVRQRTLHIILAISLAAFVVHRAATAAILSQSLFGISTVCLAWLWLAGFLLYKNRGDFRYALIISVLVAVFAQLGAAPFCGAIAAVTCLCLAVGHEIKMNGLAATVLTYLGDLSYPLYLVHLTAFSVVFLTFRNSGHVHAWLYPVAALALAFAVLHLVDYPSRTLAHRLGR